MRCDKDYGRDVSLCMGVWEEIKKSLNINQIGEGINNPSRLIKYVISTTKILKTYPQLLKYKTSTSGRFDKILRHIHWCLTPDLSSGTFIKTL